MISWFFKLKHPFTDEKDRQVARILTMLILASLTAYLVVFLCSLYFRDWKVLVILVVCSAIQSVPLLLLHRGRLLASSWILSVSTLGTLTLLATFGQGYRDFAIFGFPILLVFISMTGNRSIFIINFGLMLASIVWLVFGEMNGWFVPVVPQSGTYWPDFFVLTAILLVAAFAVYLLVVNMQRNLERAQKEIALRKETEGKLKESNIEKETLLRILSHDLVNLISSGRQVMMLMAEDQGMFTESEKAALTTQVTSNLSEACKLIDLSRQLISIESGKIQVDLVRCDIVPMVREVCTLFRQNYAAKGLSFDLEMPDFLFCSRIEPTVFKHTILGNLVSNAIKFSFEGQAIRIRLQEINNKAVLEISNIGPEIPFEKQQTLFSVSVGTTTVGTRGEKGTGLGLPLVSKFVLLMNGTISVDSKPSINATNIFTNMFTIQLPTG